MAKLFVLTFFDIFTIMIEYNPKNWVFLLSHKHSRYVFRQLLPAIIYVGIYTSVVTFIFHYYKIEFKSTTSVHQIMGIVLGFFLVFRTNGAYDRWWEGRKTWGSLVNNCRNLSMKLSIMVPENHKYRNVLYEAIVAFPKVLKEHLREGLPLHEAENLRNSLGLGKSAHIPNAIAKKLLRITNELKKEGTIDAEQYRVLDSELTDLTDITGICERIKTTPIPYSYSMFMKKFIFIFIVTLPFAFITQYGYWTIGIVLLLLYILLSIELLAEEIEDPFGNDINDLPTDLISEKIETNVRDLMSK